MEEVDVFVPLRNDNDELSTCESDCAEDAVGTAVDDGSDVSAASDVEVDTTGVVELDVDINGVCRSEFSGAFLHAAIENSDTIRAHSRTFFLI